jgi:hypothetical protein
MENSNSLFPPFPPPENEGNNDDDKDEKSEKTVAARRKRRLSLEDIFRKSRQKEDVGLDIAKSLFELRQPDEPPLTTRSEKSEEPEVSAADTEETPEIDSAPETESDEPSVGDTDEFPVALTSEEVVYVNQKIASEHLLTPITEEEPEPPVTDFLTDVVAGKEPQAAYTKTIEEHHLASAAEQEHPNVISDNTTDSDEELPPPAPEASTSKPPEEAIPNEPAEDNNPPRTNNPVVEPLSVSATGYREASTAQAGDRRATNATHVRIPPASPVLDSLAVQLMSSRRRHRRNAVMKGPPGKVNSPADFYAPPVPQLAPEAFRDPAGKVVVSQEPFKPLPTKTEVVPIPLKSTESTAVKKLNSELRRIERNLSVKEINLQQLSRITRELHQPVEPPSRTTEPRQESRLNLSKPKVQQVEQIGKVLVATLEKENQSLKIDQPAELSSSPADRIPEKNVPVTGKKIQEVKSLRREDLLVLSSKINVQGTNLKRIYENNLISEKTLRELVIDHLKGRDIRDRLRREILDKQMNFEQDPRLRDQQSNMPPANHGTSEKPDIFGAKPEGLVRFAAEVSRSEPGQTAPAAPLAAADSTNPAKNDQKTVLKPGGPLVNIVLSIIFVLLIAVIVYLLLRRF